MGIAADAPCGGNRPKLVIVRAFVKKTPKTPRAEIELALKRAKEVT